MPTPKQLEEGTRLVLAAGAAAAKAYADHGAPGAVLAAGLATAPAILAKIVPAIVGRKERQAQQFWSMVIWEDGSEAGAQAQIASRIDEPALQEVIISGFKTVYEAISPVVLPAIALLTRDYLRQGAKRDHFFRSVGEVLVDIGEDEYDDLRALVGWLATFDGPKFVIIHLEGATNSPADPTAVPWEHLRQWEPALRGEPVLSTGQDFPIRAMRRVFQLLKKAWLANDGPAGGLDSLSGPNILGGDVEDMRRFAAILPPKPPPET